MILQDWMKLKNGTDVRGVAIDGVEGEKVDLTNEVVFAIARAFYTWLKERSGKNTLSIAVGYDSRLSAERMCNCVKEGICACGGKAVVTGLSSTPSMFMLLKDSDFSCDGSIMITASHLPYHRNGLKFFVPEGGLEGEDVKEILTLAHRGKFPCGAGSIVNHSFMDKYCEGLVSWMRSFTGEEKPLSGKKIIVDAGNGAGGFYAEKVLAPLGADTTGSQFLEPDGSFPNHIPNPENKAAMQSICRAVVENKADFGVIFDTDVDRAGAVGKDGKEINRNRLIALISAILLKDDKGAYIVTDSVTSDGLTEFIEKHGGVHRRFKRGYKNVINEAKRLCEEGKNAPLAIETSGHAALKENYFLDDGAYLVTRLLAAFSSLSKEGKDMEDLISDLPMPLEEAELRPVFSDPSSDFHALGTKIMKSLLHFAKEKEYITLPKENFEGVRMNFDADHGNGWVLVRMSLHEPILPINAESRDKGGCKILIRELLCALEKEEGLDLTVLRNYLA